MSELFKVLLADDEWIIRDGLRSFDWEKHGCRVVADAEDGESALLLSQALVPDIVLADIKMPGLDGLALAHRLKEINPDVEILLLTGYDNFDYAQEAIRAGVREYLLKPTDFQVLDRTIAKVCNLIAVRREKQRAYKRTLERYEYAKPILMDKLAADLLNGRIIGTDSARDLLEHFGLQLPKYIVVAAQITVDEQLVKETGLTVGQLSFGMSSLCYDVFSKHCETVLYTVEEPIYRFILGYSDASSEEVLMKLSTKACFAVHSAVLNYSGRSMSFGISDIGSVLEDIPARALDAVEACIQTRFFDRDSVIFHRDIMNLQAVKWSLRNADRKALISFVRSGDTTSINAGIRALANEIKRIQPSIESIKAGLMGLTADVVYIMGDMRFDACFDSMYEVYHKMDGCENAEQLLEYVQQRLTELAHQKEEQDMDFHKQTVERIMQYISEHYSEDLSLPAISKEFCLSIAYLSKLIKKHTGKSFLDNLIDIRLERACSLLGEGCYKVYQVAEMVGYNDYSYFVSVFRKKMGITPKKYLIQQNLASDSK